MKKAIVTLIITVFAISNAFSQNVAALLSPMPGNEILEYIQVKYQVDKTEKIQNVSISNGNLNERVNRDFKSEIELFNMLGKAGWSYISESKKEDKNFTQCSIFFSRKLPMNSRFGGNGPHNQRMQRDSVRRATQGNPQSPAPAPENK